MGKKDYHLEVVEEVELHHMWQHVLLPSSLNVVVRLCMCTIHFFIKDIIVAAAMGDALCHRLPLIIRLCGGNSMCAL